jgi:hypothetical protein
MRHWGPVFAVLMAHATGNDGPLKARLRDPALKKTYEELEFAAKVWAGEIKLPKGGFRQVKKYKRRLRIAAHYLEFDRGEPRKGKKVKAEEFAAARCAEGSRVLDTSEVRAAVRFAKTVNYGPWRWWDIASRMARKNKIGQLHRTY